MSIPSIMDLYENVSNERLCNAKKFEIDVNELFITPFTEENELSIKYSNIMRGEIQKMFKVVKNENSKTMEFMKKMIAEFEKETSKSGNIISNLESAVQNLGKMYLSELNEKKQDENEILIIDEQISFIHCKIDDLDIKYQNDSCKYMELKMQIINEIEEKKRKLISIQNSLKSI